MVGFFDDVTNIQNGIGLRWPTNATGDDYIRLVITVGGVETESTLLSGGKGEPYPGLEFRNLGEKQAWKRRR